MNGGQRGKGGGARVLRDSQNSKNPHEQQMVRMVL